GHSAAMAPPIVAAVRALEREPRAAERAPPLAERQLLDPEVPLPHPATARHQHELGALGHAGPPVEAAVFQEEARPSRAEPRPARQRRVVSRIAMVDQQPAA